MNKIKIGGLVLAFVYLLAGCTEDYLYEKSYSFKDTTWSQDVKPKFVVDFTNIESPYTFTISLRTSTEYKYNNLWVFLKTITPDGETVREPYQIKITNEDGSWLGNKTGTIVETPIVFSNRKLPTKGKYTFILEQGITNKEIDEVQDITLRIEKVKVAT